MRLHAPPGKAKGGLAGPPHANSELTQRNSHISVPWTSGERIHGGFFRVSEDAIRLIAKKFDKVSDTRAAMNCYVTLCRKVNLKGNDIFEDTVGEIARDMAVEYRDAQKALRLVETIGLVQVRRRKIPGTKANAPSIYSVKTFLRNVRRSTQEGRTLREQGTQFTSPQLSQELPQEIHTYIPKEDAHYE
jgi:hypothetical protein